MRRVIACSSRVALEGSGHAELPVVRHCGACLRKRRSVSEREIAVLGDKVKVSLLDLARRMVALGEVFIHAAGSNAVQSASPGRST